MFSIQEVSDSFGKKYLANNSESTKFLNFGSLQISVPKFLCKVSQTNWVFWGRRTSPFQSVPAIFSGNFVFFSQPFPFPNSPRSIIHLFTDFLPASGNGSEPTTHPCSCGPQDLFLSGKAAIQWNVGSLQSTVLFGKSLPGKPQRVAKLPELRWGVRYWLNAPRSQNQLWERACFFNWTVQLIPNTVAHTVLGALVKVNLVL